MSADGRLESQRDAYGAALLELGARDPRLTVLDADLGGGTGTRRFQEAYPDRAFDLGVTDAATVAIAAGLALDGRTTFVGTNAVFAAGEAYNFVRQSVCFNRANVKIVGVPSGLLPGPDGGTVQMLEDLGLMRGLPGMTVAAPADAPSARSATLALAERPGPAYLRLSSVPLPTVTDGAFEVGRATELRGGSDLTIVAVGALVHRALAAADDLARIGLSARVLDLASVKPFDEPAILRAARDTGAILVLEEHTVLTGVGALVAATTAENEPVPVRRVGVPDVFGESGSGDELWDHRGLSVDRIRDEAWELLKSRGKVS